MRAFTGEQLPMIPLPLFLEWSDAAGDVLDTPSDGENLFNHFISAIDDVLAATQG